MFQVTPETPGKVMKKQNNSTALACYKNVKCSMFKISNNGRNSNHAMIDSISQRLFREVRFLDQYVRLHTQLHQARLQHRKTLGVPGRNYKENRPIFYTGISSRKPMSGDSPAENRMRGDPHVRFRGWGSPAQNSHDFRWSTTNQSSI